MSIYRESKADILAYFNKKNNLSLALADVVFSVGAVNDNANVTANSKCKLTMAASQANYQGSTIVYYDRVSIADWLALSPAIANPPKGVVGDSVYTLLSGITQSTGVPFTTSDLVETTVEDDGSGGGKVLLKAKPTSIGWTGQGYLALKGKPQLSSMFTTDTITWS